VDRALDAHFDMINVVRFTVVQVVHLNLQPQQEKLSTSVLRDVGCISHC
jgi:hypothetical protein